MKAYLLFATQIPSLFALSCFTCNGPENACLQPNDFGSITECEATFASCFKAAMLGSTFRGCYTTRTADACVSGEDLKSSYPALGMIIENDDEICFCNSDNCNSANVHLPSAIYFIAVLLFLFGAFH